MPSTILALPPLDAADMDLLRDGLDLVSGSMESVINALSSVEGEDDHRTELSRAYNTLRLSVSLLKRRAAPVA